MPSPHSAELPRVLVELVLESPDLQDFLHKSAALASREFSGPDSGAVSCAVTLLYKSRPRVVASSNEQAKHMDEIQYSYGDGPCLTAAHSGRPVLVEDLSAEQRWPDYTSEVSRHGLRSLLAVPIALSGDYLSALNLYAVQKNAFSAATAQAAEVMGQSRCSQQQAFDVLRAASSHRNMKLREVAESVVASVNGRPAETHFEG